LHFGAQSENWIDSLNQNEMDNPETAWTPRMSAAVASTAAEASISQPRHHAIWLAKTNAKADPSGNPLKNQENARAGRGKGVSRIGFRTSNALASRLHIYVRSVLETHVMNLFG
jgi:hypothetical protein